MSSRSKSLAFALGASSCLLAGIAFAQSSTVKEVVVRPSAGNVQTHAETVSYVDLDLGHEAGAKALLARLSSAAKRVCAPAPVSHESDAPYRRCVDGAVDRAVTEVNRPTVNALHGGG